MKSKIITSYKLILVLVLYALTSIQVFAQYSVMEVVEIEFTSQVNYSNAYLNVDVWVNLTGPGGAYTIPVFWDGEDSNGDDVFRVRLVATSPGTWNWNVINTTVPNSDSAFTGANGSGSFTANAPTPTEINSNPNNRGFIRVAENNRTLEYADGTPFFYTADTSWSALTKVFGFDTANTMTEISFQDYFTARKNQGFNGLNVIASFPNDTYTQLWSSETYGQKTGPNGETPFTVNGVVDYKDINPAYWQSVDIKMQYLADQGFVTLLETVRRTEEWPLNGTTQTEKDAFYNYVRYLWARYGCYNMIFSWVHHDVAGGVYNDWVPLVQHANEELEEKIGDYRMPYGQPRTAMSFNTSLVNWNLDVPTALDIQNVSNSQRDETMHEWLRDIYHQTNQPALNLEPFYPGWGLHSSNEINPGLDDTTMAQMQMYGSVLSGGLAGHAWGDAWYAGAAASTSNRIVPINDPQVHALGEFLSGATNQLENFESQAMGHLRTFMLDSGHEYHRLIPAADTNLSNSQNFIQTLSISDDKQFALGFFTTSYSVPDLTNLLASEPYRFEWWDVTNGVWINASDISTTSGGQLVPPARPDNTKNWAYRIRSLNYINGNVNNGFALRINAGSSSSATYQGNTFVADNQNGYTFSGGTLTSTGSSAFTLAQPFKSIRYTKQQQMEYLVPVSNGDYEVILHFAESYHGVHPGTDPDTRKFNVDIEGTRIETDLNIISEVGVNQVYTVNHNASVSDGQLNLTFSKGSGNDPIINAIEILGIDDDPPVVSAGSDQTITLPTNSIQLSGSGSDPDGGVVTYAWSQNSGPSTASISSVTSATPTVSNLIEGSYIFELTVTDDETDSTSDLVTITVDPEPNTNGFALRINAGSSSSATYQGNTFVADNQNGYTFSGGTLTSTGSSAFTLAQPFKSIRYTKQQQMEYLVPVSNGDYEVILHFAESYHGVHPGTDPDTRKFNVDIEGTRIETDLNIISEVGVNQVYTVNHNASVSDGQLNLTFSKGSGNDPIINAIEVLGINDPNPANGLVGHWPLNEQNGTSANDDSGQGYSGTLENGLSFDTDKTTGQIGGALVFDGLDDRIGLPDIDDDLQSGFSVSAWVKPSNAAGGYQGVVGSSTSGGFMMFIRQGKLAFKVSTNENGNKLVSAGTVQSNVWQMITCTFDGSDMRWYIDGANVHTEPHSGTLKNRNEGWIGWSGWGSEYFEGAIDDARIYDHSLSANQINDLYLASLTSVSGHWSLNEQNGTIANDDSGQGYTGTLENGLSFDTDKTTGQIGGALIFDGSNDRISLPDIDDDLQSGFSVSAWVKPINATGDYQGVVGTTTSGGFMMFIKSGKLAFKVTTNENGNKLVSAGTVQSNVWQMITCTFDGSDMRWYIDGVNVHSEPHSGTLQDKSLGWIGWAGWSSQYFEGAIDDVRLYDSVLTAAQVVSLFQNAGGSTNLRVRADLLEDAGVAFVLPNPTKGRFIIAGLPKGVREIIVSDFSSRVLVEMKTNKDEYELDLSPFPNGVYIVKVLQNGLERIFKVVKE